MPRAVYPGTFDPITLGHLDILKNAVVLFDEVVVAVMHNPSKQPLFKLEERIEMVRQATQEWTNVSVDSFSGLLVDYYLDKGFQAVVRGIRNASDLQVEMQMAHMNEALNPQHHTVFFPTTPKYSFVSSSLVKDVAMHGGDISQFVTPQVNEAVRNRLGENPFQVKR
ncbi:pantetheine-phosphate adenylyltransferase [Alicyclobacillus dauci]|uniref:Phosphopantetheine adenylyltransferase n=1 Tax=Alicyclobacillus dauci TaxID=1475485 RepID=A0ABY6Z0I6_9BACL|nr:pantetheine-phosphate adenylyltransferase [Alicyclobacillus dauci]